MFNTRTNDDSIAGLEWLRGYLSLAIWPGHGVHPDDESRCFRGDTNPTPEVFLSSPDTRIYVSRIFVAMSTSVQTKVSCN